MLGRGGRREGEKKHIVPGVGSLREKRGGNKWMAVGQSCHGTIKKKKQWVVANRKFHRDRALRTEAKIICWSLTGWKKTGTNRTMGKKGNLVQ